MRHPIIETFTFILIVGLIGDMRAATPQDSPTHDPGIAAQKCCPCDNISYTNNTTTSKTLTYFYDDNAVSVTVGPGETWCADTATYPCRCTQCTRIRVRRVTVIVDSVEVVIFECSPPGSENGDTATRPVRPDEITWQPFNVEYPPGDPACGQWPVAGESNQRPAAVRIVGQLLDPDHPSPWIVGRTNAGELVIVTNGSGELLPAYAAN